ncbi:MAG: PAS domain S-box protein [Magnetococcales bacterium]|nr:PAS domain S-box protein [Magnetococcales bacterium]
MSLTTHLLRWIVTLGVIASACGLALVYAHFSQDRLRHLHMQADQILDLVFDYRDRSPVDRDAVEMAKPWCSVAKHFNDHKNTKYVIKDLSLEPLNPLNYPLEPERAIIKNLATNTSLQDSGQDSGRWITRDGVDWYILARPIHFATPCLKCHDTLKVASPKGDLLSGIVSPGVDSVVAATFVYLDQKLLEDYNSDNSTIYGVVFGWIGMVCLLLWWGLKKQVLNPLAVGAEAMERMVATGKREPLETMAVPTELRRIYRAFDGLGMALESAQSSLNAGKKELEEEENRFRSLTQSAVDAIISADENGLISSWNQSAERLFGYLEKEMLGKSVSLLIPEKMLPAHLSGYAAAVATGTTRHRGESLEVQGVRKDGQWITLEITLSTWSLAGRQYFAAIIRNIDKRKKNAEKNHRDFMSRIAINSILEVALKSLSLQEKLTRSLQIILAVPWLALQYKGAIFLMNHQTNKLEMLVEQGLSEKIRLLCREISPGQCHCGRAAMLRQLVFSNAVDETHTVQFENMAPHGHYCVPILLGDRLLGVINLYLQPGHVRDVGEIRFLETVAQTLAGIIDRKVSERKVRYLSQAMEQSPISVVITDTRGRIEYVNPHCCRTSGYDVDELLGKSPNIFKSGEISAAVYHYLWKTILSGNIWRGELYNRRKNGELFWEDASISPIRNEHGNVRYFMAVKEDITQRKNLENALADLLSTLDIRVMERTRELNTKIDELEHTRGELVKSEKMASLGRLVAGFAHEINTPIGVAVTAFSLVAEAVKSMETLLERDEVTEEEIHGVMSTIRDASELALANISRAGTLVASFKRTSVDQSSDIQRLFTVREVVEDVIRSLHNPIKKTRVSIHVQVDPGLKVFGWPGALEQILTNFIINSLTYGYQDESLDGTIVIAAFLQEDRMVLDYSDDGCGMEESVRNMAFEPFFTTGRGHGGSGLGLYLCYNIVTSQLNGTISCVSSPGHGVQFHISFPVGGSA